MKTENIINNDLIIISYFMNENGWEGASKTNYQRVLYFATALAPIFTPDEESIYEFSNTIFGPYNSKLSDLLRKIFLKGYLKSVNIKVYKNRVEERYEISDQGIKLCHDVLFKLDYYLEKITWFRLIVKTLSIYGESFLSKLINEDPNVLEQNELNRMGKIDTSNSESNLTKEFFFFLREKGKTSFNMKKQKDADFLLLFFDVLYRKYKGGNQ